MKSKLFLLLLLVGFVFACQSTKNQEMTAEQRQKIADTIRQRTQDWLDMTKEFNPENLDMFLDFWVENEEKSWMNNPALSVSNLTVYATKDKIKELWDPIVAEKPSYKIELIDDHIAVLSEDNAIHVFKANYWITDTEGNTSKEHTCIITNVYVRKNDVWKILHHHQSFW